METASNLVKNLIQDFRKKLSGIYPEQEVMQFIYILFEEYLGWEKTRVHLSFDAEIQETAMKSFDQAMQELCSGKPIQYVISKSWFNGTRLKVDAKVLIPRPETEELCSRIKADYVAQQKQPFSILDIGTGSGCIAIDLKTHFPRSMVTAIDNSRDALEIASENARTNQCAISFLQADILDQVSWPVLGKYNIIISNPPYVLENEKNRMHRNVIEFEPVQALFVDDHDPLIFYRAISAFAVTHLIPPARLYFEINERFGKKVSELVHSFGFNEVRVIHDFHGKERFVVAFLKSPV